MFCTRAHFHHVPAVSLEGVLEANRWTDIIQVEVDGALVYEDTQGLADDLVPALDTIRELHLHHRVSWTVSLGRQVDVWEQVSRVAVNPFGVTWEKSARHRGLEPRPEESARAHHERLVGWLDGGGLSHVREVLTAQLDRDIAGADRGGLHYDNGTRRGPWLELLGIDPEDPFGDLHRRYGGADSQAVNRVLRDVLAHSDGVPPIDVVVDHAGVRMSLAEFRDALVMLQTPIPRLCYAEDGTLEVPA